MSWKKHARVFSNGQFWIYTTPLTGIEEDYYQFDGWVGEIIGIRKKPNEDSIEHIQIPPEDCTLIARSLDDLTVNEWIEVMDIEKIERDYLTYSGEHKTHTDAQMTDILKLKIERGDLTASGFLYLLSIGMYPFNPWDFKVGHTEFQNGEVHHTPAIVIQKSKVNIK